MVFPGDFSFRLVSKILYRDHKDPWDGFRISSRPVFPASTFFFFPPWLQFPILNLSCFILLGWNISGDIFRILGDSRRSSAISLCGLWINLSLEMENGWAWLLASDWGSSCLLQVGFRGETVTFQLLSLRRYFPIPLSNFNLLRRHRCCLLQPVSFNHCRRHSLLANVCHISRPINSGRSALGASAQGSPPSSPPPTPYGTWGINWIIILHICKKKIIKWKRDSLVECRWSAGNCFNSSFTLALFCFVFVI